MKYTEKIHAERLLKMLNKKDPCRTTCPASKYYNLMEDYIFAIEEDLEKPHDICMGFLGYGESLKNGHFECPCDYFGTKEAIKRTWLALEEKGYI